MRVLFVGNSYTTSHDMPAIVGALAAQAGRAFEAELVCAGGMTLAGHLAVGRAADRIAAGGWDAVVLQEQSQVPAFPEAERARAMDPAVAAFVARAHGIGARPWLVETWARRDGDPANWPGDTYAAMQARAIAGVAAAAAVAGTPLPGGAGAPPATTGVGVVPVGRAWRRALALVPPHALWEPDGSHPTVAGAYLAALVHTATLFGEPAPAGGAPAGVAPPLAETLRAAAAEAVAEAAGRDPARPAAGVWGGPTRFIVGARPVRFVPMPDGGLDVEAYDWETGGFRREMGYLSRCLGPDPEVDEVDEATFEAAVAALRRERRGGR